MNMTAKTAQDKPTVQEDEGQRRVTFGVMEGGGGGGGGLRLSPRGAEGGGLPTTTTKRQKREMPWRKRGMPWLAVAALVVLLLCHSFLTVDVSPPPPSQSRESEVGPRRASSYSLTLAGRAGAYRGLPWHNERTVAVETLGETKFARCDVHTVLSEDGSSVINDWIFLEEIPAVNVIVHTLEGRYVIFRQRKYAIPGETLSPVGGFVNEGESPSTAAKREVLEELGLGSRRTLRTIRENIKGVYDNGRSTRLGGGAESATTTLETEDVARIISESANPPSYDMHGLMDGSPRTIPSLDYDADWVFLGRYRTAANRGGGFLYSYLLKNAVPLVPGGGTINYNNGGRRDTGDDESQSILFLGEDDVMKALAGGKFQEVKWAATFALAMLHVRAGMLACCGNHPEWKPPEPE